MRAKTQPFGDKMKIVLSVILLISFMSGTQAQETCTSDLTHFQNLEKIYEKSLESGAEDLNRSVDLIKRRKFKKAKPLLVNGKSRLQSLNAEIQKSSNEVLTRTSTCRRESGFLLIVFNKLNRHKNEIKETIEIIDMALKKYY